MWKIGAKEALLALSIDILFFTCLVSGEFPRAQNVTWISTNFKTLLTWGPKPSENYSYTVQYSVVGENRENNPHCIQSRETMCDLSASLSRLKESYIAVVQSEPPRGVASDLVEPPYTRSQAFCPYQDTDIDRPDFTIVVGKDKRSVTLNVMDPLTALFDGNQQQSIRDVFGDELQYRVTYRRHSSTGKKEYTSAGSVVELKKLDRGESYCFEVQAYIPSRKPGKRLGAQSQTQCSEGEKSFTDVYSVPVIAGGILLILVIVSVAIVVAVVCLKCRRKAQETAKERELL
ncbi:coagulation factor IIIa isoform X2 [Gadus chalcogrammus]|uniref:coagulation factor IIIa isoform X2 n=1 Tax=Gadus chalcogrammus TaxID=1042646 RepID=UPI0024C495A5|nr:coagulation factor IIIa isoform X2 [Gadus chalcogrammus]